MDFLHDQPAKTDAFNRIGFAKTLSKAICLPKGAQGLVIGIEGEWGTGKSSLINFVKDELITYDPLPIIVDFNPWMVSGSPALVEILLSQLATAIGHDSKTEQARNGIRASRKLLEYVGLLKNLKQLRHLKYVPSLSWAGNIAEDVASMAEEFEGTIDSATKTAGNVLDKAEKLLPKLDLSARKQDVISALNDFDRPIIIIVDDLDRLPPDELRSIVQAVKAVADFPRVTYLLAYDANIVARALDTAPGSLNGHTYLEKIVQISYPIPPAFFWQLREYAERKIRDLLSRLTITLKPFEEKYFNQAVQLIAQMINHPRDVVRLINRLIISLSATHGEINVCDVMVIEAIIQRAPSIRKALIEHPEEFLGHTFSKTGDLLPEAEWQGFRNENRSDANDYWQRHLVALNAGNKGVIGACQFLFPFTDKRRVENSSQELRLSVEGRLIRFFTLATMSGEPSIVELQRLLLHPSSLKWTYEGSEEEWGSILLWLAQYVESLEIDASEELAQTLMTLYSRQVENKDVTYETTKRYQFIFLGLFKKISDLSERDSLFGKFIENASLSLSYQFILSAAGQYDLLALSETTFQTPENWRIVSSEESVAQFVLMWCVKFKQAVQEGKLLLEPHMHKILFTWRALSKEQNELGPIVKNICATSDGLRYFIEGTENGATGGYVADLLKLVWDRGELAEAIEQDENLRLTHSEFLSVLKTENNS